MFVDKQLDVVSEPKLRAIIGALSIWDLRAFGVGAQIDLEAHHFLPVHWAVERERWQRRTKSPNYTCSACAGGAPIVPYLRSFYISQYAVP
jgi:hypothetical protein